MAALTSVGFTNSTMIIEGKFIHVEVELFLNNLEPHLTEHSVALFDNASIRTMEETLYVIDRIFGWRWARNVEYYPPLAPVERGFSAVWSLVRARWIEAMDRPLTVLREAFTFYSVGQPKIVGIFLNVYFQNHIQVLDEFR